MIRAIIVDDEQPAVDKLAKMLKESGIVDIKGQFTDPVEALDYLENVQVDVAFLDIEMPGIDGIEMSNRIIDFQGRIEVVFVTAYSEYAVEAFRLNALDYLVKPIKREHLKETLDRIVKEKNISVNSEKIMIHCFGKFKVIAGMGEVKFRTAKAEELLAFFINLRGYKVTRNEIIDHIWRDYEGDKAVIHFNTTLHYVKKALLQYEIDISIERLRNTYRLNIGTIDCDYYRLMWYADALDGINGSTVSEYEEAAELYTGDYLRGSEYQWAERDRIFAKEKYIHLILALADYYKLAGEYDKLIKLLKSGLMHEPLHSTINYRLIEGLILMRDRISAVKYFNIYRRGLKKEYGLEPDSPFKKLIGCI